MGHRNWIVVADSAYPAQNRAGIETIVAGGDQLEAVKKVLTAIDEAKHVQAKVYFDKELDNIARNLRNCLKVEKSFLPNTKS